MNATRLSFSSLHSMHPGGAALTSGCNGDDVAASPASRPCGARSERRRKARFPSEVRVSRIIHDGGKTTATSRSSPRRVVASIVPGESTDRIVMFDSPNVTLAVSQFASANARVHPKNLSGIKTCFRTQAAPRKT